jgi:hypothetical protein
MEWFNIFSYWGFVAWILWLLKVSPVSPSLILFINLAWSILFLTAKYHDILRPVVLFILISHAVPAWSVRRAPLDIPGTLGIVTAYLTFLAFQGLNPALVYKDLFEAPQRRLASISNGEASSKSGPLYGQ